MEEGKRQGGHKAYPAELRERSVRMVQEHRGEYPSELAAITSISRQDGDAPGHAAAVGPEI